MSKWTHSICDDCWHKKEPEIEPSRLVDVIGNICCFCGLLTTSGIYVREDPTELLCKGVHNDR